MTDRSAKAHRRSSLHSSCGRGRRGIPSTPHPDAEPQPDPAGDTEGSLIDRTRTVWEPRYGRALSGEEARQIAENMVGFFRTLIAMDTAARARQDAETEIRNLA